MRIAFDWQGTLDVNPILMEMAYVLQGAGWEVWILSAMPFDRQGEREGVIMKGNKYNFPVSVVYHERENYHQAAGQAKVAVMKSKDIELLVDDNEIVCDVVRKAGFKALLL